MKKIAFIFMFIMSMLFTTTVNAQTYYYKTTSFAYKYKYGSTWTDWTDWSNSNIRMKIDLDNEIIVIYSNKTQIYKIIEYMGTYIDESGGKQTKFFVIDQDDDNGYVRLRIEKNGNSQIYVDFVDLMWVYNVIRIQ